MHQNKLIAVIAIVVGVVSSLAIVSNVAISPGECITVTFFGDSGVKRCKEGNSNLSPNEIADFEEIIAETTQLEMQQLESEKQRISQSEPQYEERISVIEQNIENLAIQQKEKLEAIPYLQPSDYELLQRNLEQIKSEIKQSTTDKDNNITNTEYMKQESYSGDCKSRPQGTVCLSFSDGYVWLIDEPVMGWEDGIEQGKVVKIAIGSTSKFYHILDTNLVKIELK